MNDTENFILLDQDQIRIVNFLYEKKRAEWPEISAQVKGENPFSSICSLIGVCYVEKNKRWYSLTEEGKKYMDKIEKL